MSDCDDCGSRLSSYSNGCPGCGAPICCQRCCDRANLALAIEDNDRLRAQLDEARRRAMFWYWRDSTTNEAAAALGDVLGALGGAPEELQEEKP